MKIDTQKLAEQIESGIRDVRGVYCATKFAAGSCDDGNVQVQVIITREQDEMILEPGKPVITEL